MDKIEITPFEWMGNTVQQEHILRYLDRENPVGKVSDLEPFGKRGLIVTDENDLRHAFICQPDGSIARLSEEVQR